MRTCVALAGIPKKSTLEFSSDPDEPSLRLRIECSPSYGSPLNIGRRYIFGNRFVRPIFSTRRSCYLEVVVDRMSEAGPEIIKSWELSESKIGRVHFGPEEKGLLWFLHPGQILARVFVSDDFFDRLVAALQSGKRAKYVQLTAEERKRGTLEYETGTLVWKLESASESSFIDVESMSIEISL